MNLSPVGIYRSDLNGHLTYVNERWREIMGIEGEAALGDGWTQSMHPDDLAPVSEVWQKFISGEVSAEYCKTECRIIRPDGTLTNLISQSAREYGANGQLMGYVGTITDVTDLKEAQSALEQSEERFSLAMLGSNDGLWDWDLKTGEFYNAPRWYEMLGYQRGELPDSNRIWEILLHPDDRQMVAETQEKWLKGEAQGSDIEVRFRHKDGHYVDILSRSILVRDDDGVPIRMVGTNTDISRRKQAEAALLESEEKFRAITENTTDFIAILDQEGVYKYISPSVARIAGVTESSLIGTSVSEVIHPEDLDGFMHTLKRAWRHSGETLFNPEYRTKFPNGKTVSFEALLTALPDVPGVDGIVVNARDITARKKAESDLLVAKEQAELASNAKSQFLSSMSHELRTPMNAILGFSQLLEQDSVEPLSERHKDFVDEILRSGHHMLALIGDVLDLAKIESSEISLDMEDHDLGPLILSCVNMIDASANQKGVSVQCHFTEPELPPVRIDALRFKQALLNLLSNAVKYNRADGTVTLECNSDGNGLIHIEVTDTGEGIPKELYDKVFEPFDRLGAESSDTPGTGIGLTVTRQLVELMGGSVGFESTVGEGTTFWIEIPVAGTESITDH